VVLTAPFPSVVPGLDAGASPILGSTIVNGMVTAAPAARRDPR